MSGARMLREGKLNKIRMQRKGLGRKERKRVVSCYKRGEGTTGQ